MCIKKKYLNNKVDQCLKDRIENINKYSNYKTLGCCCGHGVYNPSIIVKDIFGNIKDLITNKQIPRKKRFYKKDKNGFYYIPELI